MAESSSMLDGMEGQIREAAQTFQDTRTALRTAEGDLTRVVEEYHAERERLQRNAWKEEGLGWCHECKEFYPKEDIVLLYMTGREWHGGHGYEHHDPYRRIRSFCGNCAEYHLSRPRGREEEFQCFKAEKRGEDFVIFISGAWRPLSEPERTAIQIEREYIPEGEYRFGERVLHETFARPKLVIGEEEIFS